MFIAKDILKDYNKFLCVHYDYLKVMAFHMEKILGSKLYKDPVDESVDHMPSPQQLQGKVSYSIFIY